MRLFRHMMEEMHWAWAGCLLICFIGGCATTPMQSSLSLATPESFLGYKVGADYKLTTYEKAMYAASNGAMSLGDIMRIGP